MPSILAVVALAISTGQAPQVQAPIPWHLELVTSRSFRVNWSSRIEGAGVGADRMHLLVAVPPSTADQPQTACRAALRVAGKLVPLGRERDQSPLPRLFLEAKIPVTDAVFRKGIEVEQEFSGMLHRYRLVPGPGQPVGKALSAMERQTYTAATNTYDWQAPAFQAILQGQDLRIRPDEDPVAFARRAYRFVTRYYRYGKPKSERFLEVLEDRQGECGDVSILFNAILRANGIPARARAGRWIENAKGTDVAQSVHVRSEFYADGVGWIPVDATAGLLASEAERDRHFGFYDGIDFLTLHLEPDLRVIEFGSGKPRDLRWVQQVQVLLWGPNVDFTRLRHQERYRGYATTERRLGGSISMAHDD